MKVETKEILAAEAADAWEKQYPSDKKTVQALRELGPTPSPDDVDRVIGVPSWTRTHCNECGSTEMPTIQLGQEPDYDSKIAWICVDCIKRAVAAFNDAGVEV